MYLSAIEVGVFLVYGDLVHQDLITQVLKLVFFKLLIVKEPPHLATAKIGNLFLVQHKNPPATASGQVTAF